MCHHPCWDYNQVFCAFIVLCVVTATLNMFPTTEGDNNHIFVEAGSERAFW